MTLKDYALPSAILLAGLAYSAGVIYNGRPADSAGGSQTSSVSALEAAVLPRGGVALPVSWGDLGQKLVDAGVIDPAKMAMPPVQEKSGKVVITGDNAGYLLDLFWALGLANQNPILEDKTEMMNPAYGGAGRFASTGGWTLAKGDAMSHYGRHALIPLTAAEQALVDRVSRAIYRPCCGNSTHFPDCNHGMAMLGLLELMVSQGATESQMYQAALAVNSYWFPDTYLTIAGYLQSKGVAWSAAPAREILGANFSSNTGFQNIQSKVDTPAGPGGGGSCSA